MLQPRAKRYRESTARRVIEVYRALEQLEDVVTISAVARRSRVSRSTARTVLRQDATTHSSHPFSSLPLPYLKGVDRARTVL
jgi:hypothetical protein